MPPLEVDPLRLGAAVALALLVVALAAYQLGWHERGLAEEAAWRRWLRGRR